MTANIQIFKKKTQQKILSFIKVVFFSLHYRLVFITVIIYRYIYPHFESEQPSS